MIIKINICYCLFQATPIYPNLPSESVHDQPSSSNQSPNNSRISGQQNPNALRFPDIPNFTRAPQSLEERINRTYDALLSMGFNSNGGWLRQLVEYRKGNLDEILDALQPNKQS